MKVAIHDDNGLGILDNAEFGKYVTLSLRQDADIVVAIDDPLDSDPSKTVLVMAEPPGILNTQQFYDNAESYLGFWSHSGKTKNRIDFDHNPLHWPSPPSHRLRVRRKSTAITDRSVYFAGQGRKKKKDGVVIYHLRNEIVDGLRSFGSVVHAYGQGLGDNTAKKAKGLRSIRRWKFREIEECGADFVLCLENATFPGYVTEKFHDGVLSGRVPLYLGCPEIDRYVPHGIFVDLRPWYRPESKSLDVAELHKFIMSMTQGEYDAIVDAGQRWLNTFPDGAWNHERTRMTRAILRHIGVEVGR